MNSVFQIPMFIPIISTIIILIKRRGLKVSTKTERTEQWSDISSHSQSRSARWACRPDCSYSS